MASTAKNFQPHSLASEESVVEFHLYRDFRSRFIHVFETQVLRHERLDVFKGDNPELSALAS